MRPHIVVMHDANTSKKQETGSADKNEGVVM